ncbi:MAG: hypothetical protein HZB23_09840 [Deltaproteobacteria bacterium]|nr:hypothetical protein [Deltaproteobacteria bacterium]
MEKAEKRFRAESVAEPLGGIADGVTDLELALFFETVETGLSQEQEERIAVPGLTFPRQEEVLAVHWHPEHVPLNLVSRRMDTMFPARREELVIPTQHNEIMEYGDYAGVEVDCYSRGFNQKVQLLLHFQKERVKDAPVLKSMLAHTFRYRATQLFDLIHAITLPDAIIVSKAASETGATPVIVDFTRAMVKKIEIMLSENWDRVPKEALKNKLLPHYFSRLKPIYGKAPIERAVNFMRAVKMGVKAGFSLQYFYRTSEIIEEARSLGGGVVIPHPEQFWPILLAEYDVDGYEVWNPQSRRYTDFLISVVNEKNRKCGISGKSILIFMGDDTHMGEKVLDPALANPEKALREVGVQPAWDDLMIRKKLILAGMDRPRVIAEYKGRLAIDRREPSP